MVHETDAAPTDPASPAHAADTGAAADVAASLRASRELGPEYDGAIATAIVERLDASVDERVGRRLAEAGVGPTRPDARSAPQKKGDHGWTPRMTMGLVAMCFLIPLSAICGGIMGAPGLVLVWVGTLLFYLVSVVGTRR
ncbi:hypothetical protein [Streptomonospora salina]|uniref:Uncharacterized protein n=1 Tax=Streptomonospora salina TaxID=104205 RepID=A0A841EFQ4_9ACTN|nr:hypothetical protein [Streptomonospora salina]MBB6001124.1 hypothetical protein [Streptomonospora salina]